MTEHDRAIAMLAQKDEALSQTDRAILEGLKAVALLTAQLNEKVDSLKATAPAFDLTTTRAHRKIEYGNFGVAVPVEEEVPTAEEPHDLRKFPVRQAR